MQELFCLLFREADEEEMRSRHLKEYHEDDRPDASKKAEEQRQFL